MTTERNINGSIYIKLDGSVYCINSEELSVTQSILVVSQGFSGLSEIITMLCCY